MASILNFVNGVFGGATSNSNSEIQFPWNDYATKAKELGIHEKLDDVLKSAIMEISNHDEFFLIFGKNQESELEYQFDFEKQIPLIMALLKEDEKLNTMFAQVVPTRNNEELFWKSYFYKVEQVKIAEMVKYSKCSGEADQAHDELLGELDNELDDESPGVADTSNVPAPDARLYQQQLAIAIKRIEQLEERVAKLESEPDSRKKFKSLQSDNDTYQQIKAAFYEIYHENPCMPMMLRYAWHDAGTYNKENKTGGPNGSIRHDTEFSHGANTGLDTARKNIENVKSQFPNVSYADLIQIGGYAAVEYAGGPRMSFRFGRLDVAASDCTEDGRLPDAAQGVDHLRFIFYRMGFNDQEIATLSGAHCLGKAYKENSGFEGAWTEDIQKFDNSYFINLLSSPNEELLRLPTDEALLTEDSFKKWVEKFAEDQSIFFNAFAATHTKLSELGWS